MTKPKFTAGQNIAMKVPSHEYDQTVSFYRDVLGLATVPDPSAEGTDAIVLSFGDKKLWIDRVAGLSQAEIWLELVTDNQAAAEAHLADSGVIRRDDIEPLPEGFRGFWVSSPANIIHLITESG